MTPAHTKPLELEEIFSAKHRASKKMGYADSSSIEFGFASLDSTSINAVTPSLSKSDFKFSKIYEPMSTRILAPVTTRVSLAECLFCGSRGWLGSKCYHCCHKYVVSIGICDSKPHSCGSAIVAGFICINCGKGCYHSPRIIYTEPKSCGPGYYTRARGLVASVMSAVLDREPAVQRYTNRAVMNYIQLM